MAASALTLALDASTYRGSVALLDGATLLGEETVAMRGADEERLLPAVASLLAAADVSPRELAAVACGAGPGSFTSLRIAGSIAKGIALAAGVPLVVTSSLMLVVAGASPALPPGRYLAVLDAMRDERFVQEIDLSAGGTPVAQGPRRLIGEREVEQLAHAGSLTCVGPLEEREHWPHARGIARLLGTPALAAASLHDWEPDYGRLAEAQVKWEAAHGRPLAAG